MVQMCEMFRLSVPLPPLYVAAVSLPVSRCSGAELHVFCGRTKNQRDVLGMCWGCRGDVRDAGMLRMLEMRGCGWGCGWDVRDVWDIRPASPPVGMILTVVSWFLIGSPVGGVRRGLHVRQCGDTAELHVPVRPQEAVRQTDKTRIGTTSVYLLVHGADAVFRLPPRLEERKMLPALPQHHWRHGLRHAAVVRADLAGTR